jgi:hypothetical protein
VELLLLILWSRKELGLAYVNACIDDDEEDILASQKQNPWQIVLSLSLSLSLSPTPHNPRASQVDPIAISFPLPPTPPHAHFLVEQTERYLSACKTLKHTKILNP